MIKTLGELLKAMEQMPVEAFADVDKVHSVGSYAQMREREWRGSDGYKTKAARDQEKLTKRQERDAAKARRCATWARKNVKAAMFIKVTGARDGYGVREVVSVERDGVVCRQWLPNGFSGRNYIKHPFTKTTWRAENQMTTHDFSKVTGVFIPGAVDGRFTLQKIT